MQKNRPYCFIGTHPMAGTEHSGFEASFAQLFDGAKWVITPSETSCDEKVKTLVEIIEKTGAQTIFAGAQEHDRAAALISHMPMLIAQALVKTAMPEKAPSYLRWAYTLLKGRREWLQLDAHNGKLFAPYAVMASHPLDLVEMSEESFLKLRHILQGDFPKEGILFAPRMERQGNTVLVWFENWTPQDKVIRLAFNTDVYVLDICRNECEGNPFL